MILCSTLITLKYNVNVTSIYCYLLIYKINIYFIISYNGRFIIYIIYIYIYVNYTFFILMFKYTLNLVNLKLEVSVRKYELSKNNKI